VAAFLLWFLLCRTRQFGCGSLYLAQPMKIAMHYAFAADDRWTTPLGFRAELIRRGHEVRDFNIFHDQGALIRDGHGEGRRWSPQGLVELAEAIDHEGYRPDVFFHLDFGQFDHELLDPRAFPEMVWVMEAGDEPQMHDKNFRKAHKFHAILSPDLRCVRRYQHAQLHARWWTHCADTRVFKPYPDEPLLYDCVTTCGPRGAGLTERVQAALRERFFNGRYYVAEEYGRLLNRGKMVFQCSQYQEITRRVFEGMACGKMVITDRIPEETGFFELFDEGKDVVTYDSADDAIDKIRYYAEHDDERELIARSGMAKVLARHTVETRIDELEALVEILRARARLTFI
jgi:glycosyltransferase involved in cell wall biosynthesis